MGLGAYLLMFFLVSLLSVIMLFFSPGFFCYTFISVTLDNSC